MLIYLSVFKKEVINMQNNLEQYFNALEKNYEQIIKQDLLIKQEKNKHCQEIAEEIIKILEDITINPQNLILDKKYSITTTVTNYLANYNKGDSSNFTITDKGITVFLTYEKFNTPSIDQYEIDKINEYLAKYNITFRIYKNNEIKIQYNRNTKHDITLDQDELTTVKLPKLPSNEPTTPTTTTTTSNKRRGLIMSHIPFVSRY